MLPPPLIRTAFRASSQHQPRLSHHNFTTSAPHRTSEPPSDKPSPKDKDIYDYTWIQESELALIRRQKELLPKPAVYTLFRQKLDKFEHQMREKIKTNHLMSNKDLEIVSKLRKKLEIAEANNLKRVRLFDEIIRETVEEHKRVVGRLPIIRRITPSKTRERLVRKKWSRD